MEPEFVVCDEPISALDVSVQAQVVNLLGELKESLGLTMLFIAHDLSMVRYISDRMAVMYLGSLIELGPANGVFFQPKHPLHGDAGGVEPGARSGDGAEPAADGDSGGDSVAGERWGGVSVRESVPEGDGGVSGGDAGVEGGWGWWGGRRRGREDCGLSFVLRGLDAQWAADWPP